MNSLRDQIVQNVKRYDRSSIYGNYGNRQAVFDVIFKALHEALPQMEFYEIIHSIGEHASMMQASTSSRGETPHCPLDTPPGLEGVRSLAWPLQSMNALIETDEFKKEFPFIAPIQIDRCKIEENQQKLMIKPVKIFYYVRFQQQSSSSFKLTNNMIRTRKASQLNEDDPGSVEEVVRVQVCLTPNSKEDEEGVIQEERGETPSRPLPLRELFDQVSIFRKRWMQISKSNQKSNSSRPRKKQITMNAREEMKPISESSKGRGLVRIDQLPNGFTGSRGKKYLSILFRTHSNGAQEIGWTLFHSFTNDFDSSHLILEKGVAATEVDIDDFKFGTTLLVQSSSSIKEILSSTLNQSWQGPIVTSGCDMLRTVLEKFMEIPFHHFTLFDIRHEFISYQKMKQEHLLAQQVTTLLPSLLEILESLGICGDLPMNAGNMSRYILMAFMKIRNL